MKSDRSSDLGWSREVREALYKLDQAGPLSTPRSWRDRLQDGMLTAACIAGYLAALVVVAIVLHAVLKVAL